MHKSEEKMSLIYCAQEWIQIVIFYYSLYHRSNCINRFGFENNIVSKAQGVFFTNLNRKLRNGWLISDISNFTVDTKN